MKKFITLLFSAFFVSAYSYGQWFPMNQITFDSGDTLWPHAIFIDTVNYHHNIWQVGKPGKPGFDAAYSFANAIITDTLNPYAPDDTSVFFFIFPGRENEYALWGNYFWIDRFSFYYKLNIDSSALPEIEFSNDRGATWVNLIDSTPFGSIHPNPLVTTPGWHFWSTDFADPPLFDHDSLMIKFTFISRNDTSGKNGWMIDDFKIFYAFESVQQVQNGKYFSIYPNPVNEDLIIRASEKITSIDIRNLQGQTVALTNLIKGEETVHVNVADLPAGVYLVKINGTEVRKFVKE